MTAVSATTQSNAATTGRGDSSCAVAGGSVWCWGDGLSGQLGNGGAANSPLPVAVSNLAGVNAISSGGIATCALATGVWCWGMNDWRAGVGNSATDYCSFASSACSLTPAPMAAPGLANGVNVLTAGGDGACAVKHASAWCWGANDYRQLGNGGTVESHVASAVHSLDSGVTAVAAGKFDGCAVKSGIASCWGSNAFGQLGTNSTSGIPSLAPAPVFDNAVSGFTNSGVAAVTASTRQVAATSVNGASFSCALKNGSVWCWGGAGDGSIGNNMVGLGSGALLYNPLPVAVVGLEGGITSISSGGNHTCALTNTGAVWCWGLSTLGQAGSNAVSTCNGRTCSPVAVSVPELASGVTAISAGGNETCAIQGGSVWCWGSNSNGQLGKNSTDASSHPVPFKLPDNALSGFTNSGATSIAVGGSHVCAVLNGGAWCWGYNSKGQLGNASVIQQPAPVAVTGLGSGVVSVSAGETHSCALTTAGVVQCWGANASGQVGANTMPDTHVPVGVQGLPVYPQLTGPDTDGDGYTDAQEITMGKDPFAFCKIMRADVNGDGKVNIVDLSMLASHYNQTVPPAPARDDQGAVPDGKINIIDLSAAASVYNQLVSACP